MDFEKLKNAIIEMEDQVVKDLINSAIKQNVSPSELLHKGLIPGMKEVGNLFARKEYYVPEVLLASEAFYAGFNIVSPLLKTQDYKPRAQVMIGVVEGDIHDIGKNIVKVLIESSGYNVVDLGKDVKTDTFVKAVTDEKPDVLALSSLMTTTVIHMEDVIAELEKKHLRDTVKIVIGGAPVSREYAERIGADAYGEDAADAVKIIDDLTSG